MLLREHAVDYRLLNDFQRNFPFCPAPFAELAAKLGVAEGAVLRMLGQLRRDGKIARVDAVFAPKRIGASTLAAMAVAPEKLRSVAETISRFPEVNHNYQREHRYNLWFVVTAGSEGRLQAALGAIEQAAGYPLLKLPLVQEYHIDLGFPLDGQGEKRLAPRSPLIPLSPTIPCTPFTPFTPFIPPTPPTPLGELERRLVLALQEGLPLFIRPFQILASRVGCDESEVLERIGRWCEEGIIKRFGVVVRHHELGYTANAMLVQDIPDALIAEFAELLAHEPGVTLCYQRPRVLPEWPYNLFCVIHDQVRDEVEAKIAELRARLKLTGFAHDTLFSITRFKQTGGR